MPPRKPVGVALVGAGEFGATFAAQVRRHPDIRLRLACDLDPARARAALRAGGYDEAMIVSCADRRAALAAIERGAVAVVEDLQLIAGLPIDVVVEATGHPDGAATAADLAIRSGYHVAMVTKEAEIVVGPLLAARARAAGLVHTPVDGDQPSLLLGLIARARRLGLPVVAAGKATESDYVYDPLAGTVTCWGRTVPAPQYREAFAGADPLALVGSRAFDGLDIATVPDLCEMGIVANQSDLSPDRPGLHAPVARTVELPSLFRPASEGGLLRAGGVVDVFACLRRPDELSFAGGVFVVVETPDAATGRLLAGKGIPASPDGRYLLLHNPVHLLGAEAVISVLAAAEGRSTGGEVVSPRFDLVALASRDLPAGASLAMGERHTVPGLEPRLEPARPLGPDNPVPYYLAAGARLQRPVAKGRILTAADVELDGSRPLHRLRREQDAHFRLA